ncbi:MAG: molybdopterin-dependent oxidoreductase [Coriobacteriia bacterium]|nr:molybdopterin-dependent oxidoreductase [Coriobacteriia bacterium]
MAKEGTTHSLSRRSFVKGAGALGATAALAGMTSTEGWLKPAQALADEAPAETVAYTFHNMHCMGNCMLKCTARDGRLVKVEQRPNEDKRFNNICLKAIAEIEHIYGEGRIQTPMKRVGERGSGEFEAITWDEAFATIAEQFKKCQDTYGKDALWIQNSVECSMRFHPILARVLGAQAGGMNGLDNGQGNGMGQAFGWEGIFAMNTIWDWPYAKTIILTSNNMLETGIVWARGFLDAQKAGARIIVVDPAYTVTAAKADQWVPIQPGTDPAFYLGMIKHILDNDLYDRKHVLANTSYVYLVDKKTGEVLGQTVETTDEATGEKGEMKVPFVWDTVTKAPVAHNAQGAKPALEGEFKHDGHTYVTQFTLLKEQMAEYTLDWAEGKTGIPAATIAQVAEEYAAGPSIIANGVGGIDKYYNNDVAGHCYAVIASLTGNYGKRGTGAGFFHFNPTPYNAGLADWPLPEGMNPSPSPLNFYDLMEKDDKVHAAMFFGDIPTQKAANWNKTLEWIDKLDFICLADIYHSSVADYVDMILPACSKFESVDEIGGMRCFNGYVMSNQKILDPLFEAKPDFYIEKGIAEAMGYGDLFPKDTVAYAAAQLENPIPPVAGITLDTLKENMGAQRLNADWDNPLGPEIGVSLLPSGRQEPYYENLLKHGQAFPQWEEPCEVGVDNPLRKKYPLQFNQARTRFRVHSVYSASKWINELYEPHIELNPVDADERGLKTGDMVEVFNDRGSFRVKAYVNNSVRPGSAFMAESSFRKYLDGTLMQSVSNDKMNPRGYELPFGPMIPFNDTLIEVKKAGA